MINHERNEFSAYRAKRIIEGNLYAGDLESSRTPNFSWWIAGVVFGLVVWCLLLWPWI